MSLSTLIAILEQQFDLPLEQEQRRKVAAYLDLLNRWNRRVNLTSLQDPEEQLRFHFFESFWATRHFLESGTSVADVGSGAGFPGLAMKLYQPSLHVTLIEKNHKKVIFLKEVSRRLNLSVEIFHGRGEEYSGWKSQQFASLRALKPSLQLLELLSRQHVSLLLFGSQSLPQTVKPLRISKQEGVPGATRRYVTLLRTRFT